MKRCRLLLVSLLKVYCIEAMTNQEDLNKKLESAVVCGNTTNVEMLLKQGADVNYEQGYLLIKAIHNNSQTKIVSLLLDYNADTNVNDSVSLTPLMHAVFYRCNEIVPLLLNKKACVNAISRSGSTALHVAISKLPSVVTLLLDNEASPFIASLLKGSTALMIAACDSNYDTVLDLLTIRAMKDEQAAIRKCICEIRKGIEGEIVTEDDAAVLLPSNIILDIRELAIQNLFSDLVAKAQSLSKMRSTKEEGAKTAQDYALFHEKKSIADLLDWKNAESRKIIRRSIARKVLGNPPERIKDILPYEFGYKIDETDATGELVQ